MDGAEALRNATKAEYHCPEVNDLVPSVGL